MRNTRLNTEDILADFKNNKQKKSCGGGIAFVKSEVYLEADSH